jgi:transcriptional regulator with GAF, ATPase, and Fis domain
MSEEKDSARLRLLYDLGCSFAASIELHELLPLVIAKCRDTLAAEGAAVLMLDRERNEFYFPYVSDEDSEVAQRLRALRFPADLGIAGAVLTTARPLKVDNAQQDPRFYHGADKTSGLITRNLMAAPLLSRQGPIGVVEVVNRCGRYAFSEDDLRFLEALAGSIAIALENARMYAQIRESEATLRTQVRALRRDLALNERFAGMFGTSPAMTELFDLMESAAASSITVLIEGETGVGKELVARGIHRASTRADGPFLAINCAAMPETLLESELFGHRRGAFTGALRDNPGLFRSATGGSVFLDEVGDMPAAMQAKLLRVLEEQEVVPVGESFPCKVDVRVLSATNRELRAAVKRGAFREDLFYRLAVFPIKVPPLRARREDIPILAQRFLAKASDRQRKTIAGFDEAAMALLNNYEWPGNVRELQNELERAVALARQGDAIAPRHLSADLTKAACLALDSDRDNNGASISDSAPPPDLKRVIEYTASSSDSSLREARAAFEARYIADVLEQCSGNISRAAKIMRMSRVQLQRKVKDYGLR